LSLHDGQLNIGFVLPDDPLEAARLVAKLIADNTDRDAVGFGGIEPELPEAIANRIGR
jgi:hypothetical protein